MSALARAKDDIARGDLGLARVRLKSYLHEKGYDEQVVTQFAEICWQMGDWYEAGRHWMTTSAQGPDVQRAIDEYMRRCGGNPSQAISALPPWLFRPGSSPLPAEAVTRLSALGLSQTFQNDPRRSLARNSSHSNSQKTDWFDSYGCTAVFVAAIALIAIGARTVFFWIFD